VVGRGGGGLMRGFGRGRDRMTSWWCLVFLFE
jgi:hypothetical protein